MVVFLFLVKCFYGLRYFIDIICPPKRSKNKNGRDLLDSEKKVLIVKKQKKSLSAYFIISAITYVFSLI